MKSVSPKRVAISVFALEDEGIIQGTDVSREQEMKKQNRGTVAFMGHKCDDWIKEGDTVSFYRSAATFITDPEDKKEYAIVAEEHILASF